MKILDTPHKKKSAGLTALVGLLLLLLFFVMGLTYYDPPVSYGMEVNFGTLAQGSGTTQPQQPVSAEPTPIQKEPKVEKSTPQPTPKKVTPEQTPPVLTEKESTVSIPEEEAPQKAPHRLNYFRNPEILNLQVTTDGFHLHEGL